MIANIPSTTPPVQLPAERAPQRPVPATPGRPAQAERPSAILSLSPQASARYAEAANQEGRAAAAGAGPPAVAEAPAETAATPAPAQGRAGPPPGGAAPAAAKPVSTATLDAADANQDGRVMVKEQQVYDAKWVAKQTVRWAAQQREPSQLPPHLAGAWAAARYGAMQALAA